MPELAEVELARRIWEPGKGQKVVAVDTHPHTRVYRDTLACDIESALTSTSMIASRSHGKRMLFSFRKGNPSVSLTARPAVHLELHLGMSGRLFLAEPGHDPGKHDHFILRTKRLALVYSDYRQFGRVFLHSACHDPWESLPVEVLNDGFTLNYLRQVTARRKGTSIKALLLDQTVFPGIGNWMADEICWRLHCHPGTPVQALDLALIRNVSRRVCRGALQHVADRNAPSDGARGFSPGSYVEQVPPRSWLFQHRWKAGGSCPRCRSDLERGTIATRTTAWCPSCQPESVRRA